MSKERLEALASLEKKLIELDAEEEVIDLQSVENRLKILEESLPVGEDLDGKIKVSISSDKAKAYIRFTEHKIGGNPITYKKIIKALVDEEIKGVDEEAIKKAFEQEKFDQEILVAQGIVPERGKNGCFTYLFGTTLQELRIADGELRIEEKEKEKKKVFAGQILAVRVAATEGKKAGVSVTGEELSPQRGDEIEIKAGDGVRLSDDGLIAYSTVNGELKWTKNSVCVEGKDASGKITPSVVITGELNKAKEEGSRILNLPLEKVEAAKEETGEFRIFSKEATFRPWQKPVLDSDQEKELSLEEELEKELWGDLDAGGEDKEAAESVLEESEREKSLLEDGLVVVERTPDGKNIHITLTPPQGGGLPVTFEDCLNALLENEVRTEIEEDKIREAIKENTFYIPILVASEIPSELGIDAQIEYKFDLKEKIRFKEDGKGKINLRELNLIQNVQADDLLAVKIPAKRGEKPGVRLNGEQIPPSLGKDIQLPAGANTKISEDGFELRAAISGQVVLRGGKVEIVPVYEVKGDVDFATGNIEFLGSVIIGGNVQEGFKVEASGDIEVGGLVAKGAHLLCEKNIMVSGGVSGGYIEAKGDITVKFSDNSTLQAQGDINIIEESLHSFLSAGKNILVTGGKRSIIIGGLIRAVDEVQADQIGNKWFTETRVEVGAAPWMREQLEKVEEKIVRDTKRIEEEKLNLKTLKLRGSRIQDGYEKLVHVLKKEKILDLSLKSAQERKEILETEIIHLRTGKISANIIYPGVSVKVRGITKEIEQPLKEASLWFEGDQIKVESK